MDENPGLVGPFMRDKQYTFPVLLAKSLIDERVPILSIPRNWIADMNATGCVANSILKTFRCGPEEIGPPCG